MPPVSPVDTIRTRVKQLRGHRGWTAAELGKRLTAIGIRWDRSIVANFEGGRRRTVSVDELLGLALIFDVSPTNLLVPLHDTTYQVTPTRAEPADLVRAWVRGEQPLPGTDERTFFAEVSTYDMRKRIDVMRERYELGPFPEDEPQAEKIAREGRRMRLQNKDPDGEG